MATQLENVTRAIKILSTVKESIKPMTSDNKRFVRSEEVDQFGLRPGSVTPTQERGVRDKAHQVKSEKLRQLRTSKNFPPFISMMERIITQVNIRDYGKEAMALGLGNCCEFACAAAFVHHKEWFHPNWDLVMFGDGADHIFLVIEPPACTKGEYPTDSTRWPARSVICDPWADLACPATEFPDRWRARMKNWQSMGLLLGSPKTGTKEATESEWYDAVDKQKLSLTKVKLTFT